MFDPHPDIDRAAAFERAAGLLARRAATDPAVSEDGAQRALEELWAGPSGAYLDPLSGRFDVERLCRVAVLRARDRTIDERRRPRPVSLDAPVYDGADETRGSRLQAPDARCAERLDDAAALAEIDRRSDHASSGVRIGLQAIRRRVSGYSDEEIAGAYDVSRAHLRQLICRAGAWARAQDPRPRDQRAW